MLRIGKKSSTSHKQTDRSMKRIKVVGLDFPARRSRTVAEPEGEIRSLGMDSESRRIGSEAGQETGCGGAVASLL